VVAEERIIVDGGIKPGMVKALWVVTRMPGLTHGQLFKHWFEVHGALGAKCPGIRRYVQNHAIPEAYAFRGMTHDGWSEAWFDDLDALRAAVKTPEWGALRADARNLFTGPMGIGVARELVQKEFGQAPRRWAEGLSEPDIRDRLRDQGYKSLAADPTAATKIKAADEANLLAVWTDEHIVTIDESRIDARPG
jgi:uncharacterized protein (TIGR02118 family)